MTITFDVLDRFQENNVFPDSTDSEQYSEVKYKMVALSPWKSWPFTLEVQKHTILNEKNSEIANVCKGLKSHWLLAMKIVQHHANDSFDWLISEHQSVNPWKGNNFYTVWEIKKNYVCPSCAYQIHQSIIWHLSHLQLIRKLSITDKGDLGSRTESKQTH